MMRGDRRYARQGESGRISAWRVVGPLLTGLALSACRAVPPTPTPIRPNALLMALSATPSPAPSLTAAPSSTPTFTATARPSPATPSASPSPTAVPTQAPSATATLPPTPAPSHTPQPTATVSAVTVRAGEVTLMAYAYEAALYTDPAKGHPYPLLRRDQVGPPRPRALATLVLRNEYLELTLLPALGGRVYQARFLPTGQTLFYNNPVLKPTHWGPPEQGWWLAAGGMEFCLPVEEHGYVTAEPWTAETIRRPDGSATVAMSLTERSRNLQARIEITLRPGEAGFHVRSMLHNPDAQPKRFQYWINAMLSPGAPGVQPSLRFYYPASEVLVHSRGDRSLPDAQQRMAWPVHNGRDFSLYATWQDWLGFFAPSLRQPFTAVYEESAQIGMVRAFPAEVARGSKLFAFGRGFGDVGAYADDGSQYVEMWGGLTPTFWDDATLEPRASVVWEETWYAIVRCGGVTAANAEAALHVRSEGNALSVDLAALAARSGRVRVSQGTRELANQAFAVRPEAPFRTAIPWAVGNPAAPTTVSIWDAAGKMILSCTVP